MKRLSAGFKTVLERVAKVWRDNRQAVLEQGANTIRQLQEFTQPQGAHCFADTYTRSTQRLGRRQETGQARSCRRLQASCGMRTRPGLAGSSEPTFPVLHTCRRK